MRAGRDAHQVFAHRLSNRRANAYRQESKTIAEYCANVNTNPLFGNRCGKLCITKSRRPLCKKMLLRRFRDVFRKFA